MEDLYGEMWKEAVVIRLKKKKVSAHRIEDF